MMTDSFTQFGMDVEHGLKSSPMAISSKYFYDEIGDDLFVKIMNLPEYYLTNCELEIFSKQTGSIIDALDPADGFELIELGAGDGTKTIHLLREMLSRNINFEYIPIDISKHAIETLETRLRTELPDLKFKGKVGEYFQVINSLSSHRPKAVLFLGSNIGNLLDDLAHNFISKLSNVLNVNDQVLIGFDLKKSKDIILPAYNDKEGITAKFNLNLLARINKELFADFDLSKWAHLPHYDEETGLATSHIQCIGDHTVFIGAIEEHFHFKAGDKIHTEISRKYDEKIISSLVTDNQLVESAQFSDTLGYFKDIIFKKTV